MEPFGGRGDRATAPIEDIWCEEIRGCSCREEARQYVSYALIATDFRFADGPQADIDDYSIISSARTSNEGGTVRPSAFAVFMLITSSNLVGCSTGSSAGLVPLRILST